eukprot:jgi/Bigna1/72174/fgenesh1_pg.18_\
MASRRVQTLSLRHMVEFVRGPDLNTVKHTSRFLNGQLPKRIDVLLEKFAALPPEIHESFAIQRALASFKHARSNFLSSEPPSSPDEFLPHAIQLAKAVREMDVDARSMCTTLRDDSKRLNSFPEEIDEAVEAAFRLLLPARVLVSHYYTGVKKLEEAAQADQEGGEGGVEGTSSGGKEELASRPTALSNQSEEKAISSLGPPASIHSIPLIVEAAIYDSQAFAVEKFGAAPEVEIDIDPVPSPPISTDKKRPVAVCIDAHLHYVCMEVLKNAYRAMINTHGALEVKEAAPIQVHVTSSRDQIGIAIGDTGAGLSSEVSPARYSDSFRFFHSTAPPMMANYTYSRQFGAAFDGLGFGLPLSRLYCDMMGGDLVLGNRPGYGCTAYITLDKHGRAQNI